MHRNSFCRVVTCLTLGLCGVSLAGCAATPRESATIPPVSTQASDGPSRGHSQRELDIARAADLMAEAQRHMEQAEWRAARDAYRLAIEVNPLDEEAITGHDRALAMLDQGSSIDRMAREYSLRRQQTMATYDAAIEGAMESLRQEDLGEARRRLFEARARLVRNREVLSQDEYEIRLFAVDTALKQLDQAQELRRLTRTAE